MEAVKERGAEQLIKRFNKIREQTVIICKPLLSEDHVVQPIIDVSPPKWHLGHTAWFFEKFILENYYKNYKVFDRDFNFIFNSYYERIGDRLMRTNRGNMTRPSVAEVHAYRDYVNAFMQELLEGEMNKKMLELVELGLQHEQQHQELLVTDIKYILGNNPLFPEYKKIKIIESKEINPLTYIEFPENIYEIGYAGKEFCFDNETAPHKVFLNGFKIAQRLITNIEYLEFMNDGGYHDFRHWLMEGWEMVKALKWEAPLYWIKKEGEWHEYMLGGLKKIIPQLPVTHISFYEAEAFSRWAGKRLLTEFEWESSAKILNAEAQGGNFLESGNFHPTSAQENKNQILGDAWEWTYSAYHPYPGYIKEAGALGEYNGKFMINQMVLRGGSCATPAQHIRATYRNFFHPDKRWQFTGIRLAENI